LQFIVWVEMYVKKLNKIAISLLLQLQPFYDHNLKYVKYKN